MNILSAENPFILAKIVEISTNHKQADILFDVFDINVLFLAVGL
ncbi:hypothetical protein [Legionella rowbothamii]|nr:hypothetical protein [Legionella rowbothamii]